MHRKVANFGSFVDHWSKLPPACKELLGFCTIITFQMITPFTSPENFSLDVLSSNYRQYLYNSFPPLTFLSPSKNRQIFDLDNLRFQKELERMVEAHGLQTVAIYGWVLFIQQLLGVMMMMFLGDDFHVKKKLL